MKVLPYLDAPISQAEFAEMIGVSEARISQLVSDSVLTRGETAQAARGWVAQIWCWSVRCSPARSAKRRT